MLYLSNAFSLNMLPANFKGLLNVRPLTVWEAGSTLINEMTDGGEVVGAIGHPDTAALVNNILGIELAHSRATVALKEGDAAVVAQYRGPRLPEGATELPEGAEITFSLVTFCHSPQRDW